MLKPLNNEFLKRRGLGGGFNISLDGCCGVGWMLTFGVLGAVFCTGILAAVAELRIRSGLYTCTIILGRHLAHNWQGNSGRNQFRMTSTCAAAADVTHDRDQRTVKMSGDHLTRLNPPICGVYNFLCFFLKFFPALLWLRSQLKFRSDDKQHFIRLLTDAGQFECAKQRHTKRIPIGARPLNKQKIIRS